MRVRKVGGNMKEKIVIGQWIDDMNNFKKEKRNRLYFIKKISKAALAVEASLKKNILILTFSFILAIPILIGTVLFLQQIDFSGLNHKELRDIFYIAGIMMVLPFMSVYFYLVLSIPIPKEDKQISRGISYMALVILIIFNIVAAMRSLNFWGQNVTIDDGFIFSVLFFDVYLASFLITKFFYAICKLSVKKIKGISDWVVDDDGKDISVIEAKLSFINKVITGFIAIVASLLGLLLTLNKIL